MEINFLDELLLEAENKEVAQTDAFNDLILLEIRRINEKIESNFNVSRYFDFVIFL